ncbi:hypothetical protein AJ80_06067 [Polytolypa hystricis UAMH7299]|uniref:Peptidase S33 tripeptidyl aminopeptidase-like C-terminal domain-containing protein n=1 Tax=Polytolypa hystricis (strain UAMH7299) TaxID=1447883 RepID=A0A2B7XZ56_POLH7|nr:hypothetical protein AJ80_06067 [Polytolypa hystricis UAMH7299]
MEKQPATRLPGPCGHAKGTRTHPRVFLALLLSALCFVYWSKFSPMSIVVPEPQTTALRDFADIIPTEKLEWHPCFPEYGRTLYCARLTVPMDYDRPLNESSEHPKVHIALTMLPGRNRTLSKSNFSPSPLLVNPGGPGGSGTSMVLVGGEIMQRVVGLDQDIVGFDPRGVAFTAPRADCWSQASSTDGSSEDADALRGLFRRLAWNDIGKGIGLVHSSGAAMRLVDARHKATARLCAETDSALSSGSIFRYLSTPYVARDMVSIIDAWDDWRDSSALTSEIDNSPHAKEGTADTLDQTSDDDIRGKLTYWGFSYGTFLGATFASMFPDRVGRVILDGVVDAFQYVTPIWRDSLHDTDKIVDQFFQHCHGAGKACAFYRDGDEISDIQERYNTVLENLQDQPLSLLDPTSHVPVTITISDIKSFIFMTLYAPVGTFPTLADILSHLYENDVYKLTPLLLTPGMQIFCNAEIPAAFIPSDAQYSIICGDKVDRANYTIPELESYYQQFANRSTFADVWMTNVMPCNGWDIEGGKTPDNWKWPSLTHSKAPIRTSFPILFLSNTYDPVTPLLAGLKMSTQFQDSGLIEQQSSGHCTLAAASLCTMKAIRAYLREGIVPPPPKMKFGDDRNGEWTVCPADEQPWKPFIGDEMQVTSVEEKEEKDMLESWKGLQDYMQTSGFWGMKSHFAQNN